MNASYEIGAQYPSFAAALAASREASGPRTLYLPAEGLQIDAPIELDGRDSGLTIDGRGARLLGACRLGPWTRDEDGFLCAQAPEGADPAMFLAGGAPRPRARFPQNGRLNYRTTVDIRWLNSTNGGWNRKPTRAELTEMALDPADIPETFDPDNASVTVYHEWDESTVRTASFDRASGRMILRSELEHPVGAFNKHEYVLWGIREGMKEPGQWYFDRKTRRVVYFPLPDETPETLDAWIPIPNQIFRIADARDVAIRNLTIEGCNAPHLKSGLRAVDVTGAVEAWDAENLAIENVTIRNVAGNAVKLMRCKNADVVDCDLADCGAGGIFEMETMPARIVNNRVARIGRTVYSSIGIHAGGKSQLVFVVDGCQKEEGSVLVSHNDIFDCPYCAITCNGGPHVVEYNRAIRCMTVLNDGAAIYCSRGKHTILRGNFAADIHARGAHAYYFDEMSSRCLMEDNVSVNVPSALQSHMSQHNVIRRNVLINDGPLQIRMPRSHHYRLEDNVFLANGSVEFTAGAPNYDIQWDFEDVFSFDNNVVYSKTGEYFYQFSDYGSQRTDGGPLPPCKGVLRLDPRIDVSEAGSVRLSDDSPLAWLGIQPPDGARAGCTRAGGTR